VVRLQRMEGDRGWFEPFANLTTPVASLLVDAGDRLWSGRYLLDPQNDSAYEFGRADGVDIGNPPEIGHGTITGDGLVLVGGTSGLLIIDPAQFTPWRYAPSLAVSRTYVDGAAHPLAGGGLRVVPGEKQVGVEFTALDYSAPERNLYRYRLEGYDERWIDTDAAHRVANFTNLAPGSYTLRVQGSNRAGVFSEHELAIPITVVPALWQTLPFRVAAILFLLGLTWPVYRARLAALKTRQRQLEALVDQRTADIRRAHAELESAYARIDHLSRTDTLTGVGNRRSIDLRLPVLLARIDEVGAAPGSAKLAFFLLDLDHFKAINDVHGHGVGDAVLRELGSLLRRHENEKLLATRWGGEEFLLVAQVAGETAALELGERLRTEIAGLHIDPGGGQSLAVTVSIGFACHPFDPSAPQRLPWQRVLDLADQALYAAKRAGRDRVCGARAARALEPDFEARLRSAPTGLFDDGTLELLSAAAAR
jgi:diguanylate cyclase (GGDEF)-like protein